MKPWDQSPTHVAVAALDGRRVRVRRLAPAEQSTVVRDVASVGARSSTDREDARGVAARILEASVSDLGGRPLFASVDAAADFVDRAGLDLWSLLTKAAPGLLNQSECDSLAGVRTPRMPR